MKRSIISAAVLSAVFMSAGVFAANNEEGTLTINGEIKRSSCYFDSGKDSEILQLNAVDASLFANKAVGEVVEGNAQKATNMKIICPGNSKLTSINITNVVFGDGGIIKPSTGVDTNVGFKLKMDEKHIDKTGVIDISSLNKTLGGEGEIYTLNFDADYSRLNLNPVKNGQLSATVTFSVSAE
ncbi:TPA: fimbrial protein [Citrobacter youngae]|nr:fimbrial protein [Citrobacter youngae]